jgi:hypothetical protein
MRLVCLLFLLVFIGAVVAFALQNQEEIILTFFNLREPASIALVVGAAYVLGMFSGWTVVGMLRRSFRRATEDSPRRGYA